MSGPLPPSAVMVRLALSGVVLVGLAALFYIINSVYIPRWAVASLSGSVGIALGTMIRQWRRR